MVFEDFNLNRKDSWYIVFVLIFSLGLIYFRTRYHMSGGLFYPDKALYLMNSLAYSGMDYYGIVNPFDIYFSPVISFLTAILFKLGLVDQLAISLVSSFIAIFGFVGLYLLLRIRFSSLLSLTGVIFFGSFSQVLINLSSGLIDLPSVSISILIILFGIMAVDKNSKYFLLVFPLFVIGFFTRYTVGFMLPIFLLYYVMKRNFLENIDEVLYDKSKLSVKLNGYLRSIEFKYIIVSLFISAVLAFIICKFLILDYGATLEFINLAHKTSTNVNYGVDGGIDVIYDKLFYVKNFSQIIFDDARRFDRVLSTLVYLIIGFGLLARLVTFIRSFDFSLKSQNYWKSKSFKRLLLILLIGLLFLAAYSFKVWSNHMITNICMLVSFTILYSLLKEMGLDKDETALNLLFIAYFVVYFVFIPIYMTKTLRYALPILPALTYIIIYAFEGILNAFKGHFKSNSQKSILSLDNVLPVFIIVILLASSFSYIIPMEIRDVDNDLVDVTDYIIDNDDDYHLKTFGSNYRDSRIIRWYLWDNVTFNDDYEELGSGNLTYIIAHSKLKLDNYHEIYHKGEYYLYHLN